MKILQHISIHQFSICILSSRRGMAELLPIRRKSIFHTQTRLYERGQGRFLINQLIISFSPSPEVEWISPTNKTIKGTPGKYEISDFGRVLTILQAEPELEGEYICKAKGKEPDACSVFLNVTCTFQEILHKNNKQIIYYFSKKKLSTFCFFVVDSINIYLHVFAICSRPDSKRR